MNQGSELAGLSVTGSTPLDDGMRPATAEMRQRGLFGRRVRLLREALDLSQAEFCTRYEFKLRDLSDMERGRIMPDGQTLERIDEIEADLAPMPRGL